MTATQYLLVLCTCPHSGVAETIADDLVTKHIAACVNILPGVRSYFKWEGKQEAVDEVLLIIKTTTARFAELSERITALHDYEVPEIIALDIKDGLPAYLRWITDNTASRP